MHGDGAAYPLRRLLLINMPVDRALHLRPLTEKAAPAWRCPTCQSGHLRLMPKSILSIQTAETKQAANEQWFDADHVRLRFAAVLVCDNGSCGEPASLSGTGSVSEEPDDDIQNSVYVEYFVPDHFRPSPALIDIPAQCPSEVAEELKLAFIASWGDFAASGNHIRTAAEHLLTALRVRKTVTAKTGKKSWMTLHARIEKVEASHPTVSQSLFAIKWLGNAGSHSGELTRENVYDALDIFETVLHELYVNHARAIKKLVTAVNRRKGPIRRRAPF